MSGYADTNGIINFIASTVWYNQWTPAVEFLDIFPEVASRGAIYANGMGSSINFVESAVHMYASAVDPPQPTLGAVNGGTITADSATYIKALEHQNAADLMAITSQSNLITAEGQFLESVGSTFTTGDAVPATITPLTSGALIDSITGDLVYGGITIDTDVLGNPRTDGGKRDVGAVQLSLTSHLIATDTGTGEVTLSWNNKQDFMGTGYIICYDVTPPTDLSGGCTGKTKTVSGENTLSTTIAGLDPTLHWFAVKGDGNPDTTWSNIVSIVPIGLVGVPDMLGTVCNDDGSVKLTWDPVMTVGYTIIGYEVYTRTDACNEAWSLFEKTEMPTSTITGLVRGDVYQFGVKAITQSGLRSPELGTTKNTCGLSGGSKSSKSATGGSKFSKCSKSAPSGGSLRSKSALASF